jgi:hypothetical protein
LCFVGAFLVAVLVVCACFCLLKNYLEKKNRNLKGETKEAKRKKVTPATKSKKQCQ